LSSPIEKINSPKEEHNPSSSPIACQVRKPFIVFVEGEGEKETRSALERPVSIYTKRPSNQRRRLRKQGMTILVAAACFNQIEQLSIIHVLIRIRMCAS